jgi:hypothetical protein
MPHLFLPVIFGLRAERSNDTHEQDLEEQEQEEEDSERETAAEQEANSKLTLAELRQANEE